ncbi:hypothetical protein ARAM_003118 [Aspergillus rambellii]|uniref:Uncharacterized protein n=1 Tax=Aspergillus rambellii TaxID=308745 RepID=A0A0F8W5V2_9EURO|nr:hypothetical protein ARAM_003118 [Aspergillus rambellii]
MSQPHSTTHRSLQSTYFNPLADLFSQICFHSGAAVNESGDHGPYSAVPMDPISAFGVASGAVQIVQAISDTLIGLSALRGKYLNADRTIACLEQELRTVKAAIRQLEDWTRGSFHDSHEYHESLDVALDGCRAVMEALADEISALTQGLSVSENGMGMRARIRVIWKEDVMKGHQERLHSQVIALHLLVQACQCKTLAQQVELLRRTENRRKIWKVADDAATLRSSNRYAVSRADTASSLSQRESTTGDTTVFDFDGTLAASMPYQCTPRESQQRPEIWSTTGSGSQSQTTDEGYASGFATSTTTTRTSSLALPSHPSSAISPTLGQSNSVGLRPTARFPTTNQTRRTKSDSNYTSGLDRASKSRRELFPKFQSIIRRLSQASLKPNASPRIPTRGLTGGSAAGAAASRQYEKDVNTSIDLTSPDGARAPLIVKTAQSGTRPDVERLIESGCDLEAKHLQSRRTALLVAAHCGNEAVVDLLIHKGARLDVADGSVSTALHLAASRGHCGVLELLLWEGLSVEARDARGRTPLWIAAGRGQVEATHILLSFNAKVNARAETQMTALHAAALRGDEAIVKLLIRGGADVEAKDGTTMTALHYACENGHVGVIKILLGNKASIDTPGCDRRTPLICAAAAGGLSVTQLLLDKKASSRCVDDSGMTALHWAAYNGHADVVDVLSRRKSSLTKVNIVERTALHVAAMSSQFAVVELLLRKAMPLESRCQSGFTALHYACLANSTEISRLLLMSGADIEAQMKGELQRRPVHIAATQGSMGLLNLLCDKGASLESRDALGYRALSAASRSGHAAAVQNLLDRGSPVHLPFEAWSRDDSPLCLAAMGGHLPIVTLLLQRGASVLKQDENDWWPYQYAAYHGHPRVLEVLLSRSLAELSIRGETLRLPFDGIGFAPSADISEERKRKVMYLLFQAQQQPESLVRKTTFPGSSPFPTEPHQTTSGVRRVSHIRMQPCVSSLTPVLESTHRSAPIPAQELPSTLEQGLPASRSQTPERMHRPPNAEEPRNILNSQDPDPAFAEYSEPSRLEFEQIIQPPYSWDRQPSQPLPHPPSPPPLSHPTPTREGRIEPANLLPKNEGLRLGRSVLGSPDPAAAAASAIGPGPGPGPNEAAGDANVRANSGWETDSESMTSVYTASEGAAELPA